MTWKPLLILLAVLSSGCFGQSPENEPDSETSSSSSSQSSDPSTTTASPTSVELPNEDENRLSIDSFSAARQGWTYQVAFAFLLTGQDGWSLLLGLPGAEAINGTSEKGFNFTYPGSGNYEATLIAHKDQGQVKRTISVSIVEDPFSYWTLSSAWSIGGGKEALEQAVQVSCPPSSGQNQTYAWGTVDANFWNEEFKGSIKFAASSTALFRWGVHLYDGDCNVISRIEPGADDPEKIVGPLSTQSAYIGVWAGPGYNIEVDISARRCVTCHFGDEPS